MAIEKRPVNKIWEKMFWFDFLGGLIVLKQPNDYLLWMNQCLHFIDKSTEWNL